MNSSFSLQNRVLHFFRLHRKKLSFLVNYHFCKGFKKAKIHFFLIFFFALFAISPEINRRTFWKITFFCVFLQIFFSKKNAKKIEKNHDFFRKNDEFFVKKCWNGLKTSFLPKMTNLAFQKNSEKSGFFWKMQNPADIFFRHFFVIFSHFCKNEIPWRMIKTRKNTKFAKKVSFRKLGSERREKKFRDQQFSCFEQFFLPAKPCFTLFPSPTKKIEFFGKLSFLQGV